ncbi:MULTISPECIES: hypothetical protein [unclassified Bradyrhizobium]|uniref:hypothetical protein n=1 Tax=unclassified Bradyrhizobium TaxID=2631580 RepID=UPI0028EBB788|nr:MULTISPECIES: hypothetical protein [unclassified Bradyrhizobium]
MARAIPSLASYIFESASPELHLVLRGHLHLEAVLNEILFRKNVSESRRSMFANKVRAAFEEGCIDEKLKGALLAINRLRNKLAHELHFRVTFDDAFTLVKEAARAGIDFSDDTIHIDRTKSEEWYGTQGVLTEVISNTFQHLVWENEATFTKDEIGSFLG